MYVAGVVAPKKRHKDKLTANIRVI